MLKRFPEFLPKLVPGVMVTNPGRTRRGRDDLSVSYSHANYKTTQPSRKSPFYFVMFANGIVFNGFF